MIKPFQIMMMAAGASSGGGGDSGVSAPYKHVRILIESKTIDNGGDCLAREIEFLDESGVDISGTAASYSGSASWNPIANAFDDNAGTFWGSTAAVPLNIGCSFASAKTFTGCSWQREGAYPGFLRTGRMQGHNNTNYSDGGWEDILVIPDQGETWSGPESEKRTFTL